MDVLLPRFLHKIFDRIDLEKKGLLTLEDIMQGARVDAEFQSRLRVMDIDEVDLQQLFEMSLSGACNACHFFKTITHMDTHQQIHFLYSNMYGTGFYIYPET